MEELSNSEESLYSGALVPGWDDEKSYERLMYVGEADSAEEVEGLLKEGIERFHASDNSRLDMRIKGAFSEKDIKSIIEQRGCEYAFIYSPEDRSVITEITICVNKLGRALSEEQRKDVLDHVSSVLKRFETDDDLLKEGQEKISELIEEGYEFERSNFKPEELYLLWGETFGWSLEECELLLKNGLAEEDSINGIRDSDGKLIAAMLISGGESTEWAVSRECRGKSMSVPLLLLGHSHWAKNNPDKPLYVHARHDRSISPGLRAGMVFDVDVNSEENRFGLLTNHVMVGSQYRSFLVGQLDPEFFTPEFLEYIESVVQSK